jgi:hypothetical protein
MSDRNKRKVGKPRWSGPLSYVHIGDQTEKGFGCVRSLTQISNDQMLIDVRIENTDDPSEPEAWSAALDKSGDEYVGKASDVGGEPELNPIAGTVSLDPEGSAQVSMKMRKTKSGLSVRGAWVLGSGEMYAWKAKLKKMQRKRTAG